MIEKDNIKELFSDRFSDFKADVDPQIWDNIQLEISKTPPAVSSAGNSIWSNTSYWIIGTVVTSVLAVTVFTWEGTKGSDNSNSISEVALTQEAPSKKIAEVPATSIESEENAIVGEADQKDPVEEQGENPVEPKISSSKVQKSTNSQTVETAVSSKKVTSNSHTKTVEPVQAKNPIEEVATPNKIDVAAQSSVIAMPMAGIAPLKVNFSTLADAKNIKWNFNDGQSSTDMEPEHTFNVEGIYFVTMIAELPNGEHIMEKAVVEVKPNLNKGNQAKIAPAEFDSPNFFSPNGDGVNDEFGIKCTGVESLSLSIYSVNGHLVFQTDNPNEKWNGTDLNGSPVVDGTYFYLINAIGIDQNIYVPKGYVTVRRSN